MKRLVINLLVSGVCAVLPVGSAAAAAEPRDSELLVQVGQQAPDFTAATTDKQKITLSKLRGQVVVLNFFASW